MPNVSPDKTERALRLAQAINGSMEPTFTQDDVELLTEALNAFALPSAIKAELPTELFDGYAVFEELGKHRALQPHQVSAVLDAVVRLIRKNAAPQANAEPLIGSRPIGGNVSEEPAGAAPIDGVMLARAIYALRGEHYPGDASFSASPPSSEQDRNIFDTDRSPLEKAYAVAWGALLTIANRGDLDVHGMQKFAYEQWRKAVAFEESNPQSAIRESESGDNHRGWKTW